ncbi:MAG: type I-E CRISPR-associated protein Cas7/Cse4/CasC [Treponema sp.]|nr:type I-E CRISPR-associated protein Cas7/Cse4/CasC [Treponema sp.]
MEKFIQLHFLTSFPPANLNRDDLGRPKTAKMGGVDRLRVSSQSLKRAWRTSDIFKEALSGSIGIRTKRFGRTVDEKLVKGGIDEKKASEWAKKIAACFGALTTDKKDNPLDIKQLVHISPEEEKAVDDLIAVLIKEKREPEDTELTLLRRPEHAVDIALFGRMLADSPSYNVEAACQVAHAISVHPVTIEDDYFTAVDDLNNGADDMGAAHLGETGFASALFYEYVCIDTEQLIKNLGGDEALAKKTLSALLQAAAMVTPTGKQNSFASRAFASYIMVEKGKSQPRSLSVAFLKPIRGENYGEDAYKALEKACKQIDTVYDITDVKRKMLNALTGEGTFADLKQFITE